MYIVTFKKQLHFALIMYSSYTRHFFCAEFPGTLVSESSTLLWWKLWWVLRTYAFSEVERLD